MASSARHAWSPSKPAPVHATQVFSVSQGSPANSCADRIRICIASLDATGGSAMKANKGVVLALLAALLLVCGGVSVRAQQSSSTDQTDSSTTTKKKSKKKAKA